MYIHVSLTGIGRGIVKSLTAYGAEVVALSRTQADLDSLVQEVNHLSPSRVRFLNLNRSKYSTTVTLL